MVTRRKKKGRRGLAIRLLLYVGMCLLAFYGLVAASLLLLRWVDPFTTAVQTERHTSALLQGRPYQKLYRFVPLDQMSPQIPHAVVAAEDARFFQHHGFDWKEVSAAVYEDVEEGRRRGASTITQQMVRNLFLSTSPSLIRKAVEFSIVPMTEAILSKQRILELYLNVIEWGPGIYGAEAAAEHYYHEPAARVTRQEAVALASVLPAPLHRKPGHVQQYALGIQVRMRELGY